VFGDCMASLPPVTTTSGVFVEPDDGTEPLVDELDQARCGIDVSVYILSSKEIIDGLIRAAARGGRVRVMLEQFPYGGGATQQETINALDAAGIETRWSGSNIQFSHAKFLVVDRQVALILNLNLTGAAFTRNREFGAITTDKTSVDQAQAVFEQDWTAQPIVPICGPLIVSPTDSRERFLDLIDRADESISFYAEVIRDKDIVQALIAAESRGVVVRILVDDGIDADSQDALADLYNGGAEIRFMNGLYVHAKALIIDGGLVVIGSQNFTATSLDENREVAIVLADQPSLQRCAAVFERDWLRASPGSPNG